MILTEYNEELHIRTEKQDSYEEGKAVGKAEEREQVKKIFKLHIQGKTPEEIAAICDLDLDTVQKTLE